MNIYHMSYLKMYKYNPTVKINKAFKMANHNILYFIKALQMISFYPCIVFAFILSSIWNVFFIKRLVFLVKIYRKCLKNAKTDPIRNFTEEARIYKIEIVTKIFLLIINVIEFTIILMYVVGISPGLMDHSYSSKNSYKMIHFITAVVSFISKRLN